MPRKRSISGLSVFVIIFAISSLSVASDSCKGVYGKGTNKFALATGSPGELGLLKVLAEAFNSKNKTTVCWIKAGSGKSLKLLKAKKVDVIMVHAPSAEKKAVKEGWATQRTLIGSNEFYVVGPVNDPAKISDAKSATEAYKKIADSKAKFLSRGDNSGTHKKEMSIWKMAGITPKGSWYIGTKDFMMGTLKRANAEKGYFMTDSSTWVAGKKDLKNIKVLFKGDKYLVNTYHGLCQPKGATQGAKWGAMFITFLGSEEGQKIIRNYGKDKYGQDMYNDAAYAKKYDH